MKFFLGILGLLYIISPLFVWAAIHWHWRKLGKDPIAPKAPIIPQYESFHNLPPALIGVVYDTRANTYDITSTLLDFAARGLVKIENNSHITEHWHGKIQYYRSVDYKLTLVTTAHNSTPLYPYEKMLLETIFAQGNTVQLETVLRQLGKRLPQIRQQLYTDAVAAELFTERANLWRNRYWKTSRRLIGVGLVTGLFGIGIPVLLYGVAFRAYSFWMSQKTPLGMEAAQWCEGFKLYLHHAERFRARKMTIEEAERILPYIIVLHLQIPAWQLTFPSGTVALSQMEL